MKSIIVAMLTAVLVAAAPTQIRDTGYTGFSGTLFSGRITLSGPDMTTQDGRTVNRWEQSYTITNGVISIDLEPNDTAVPTGTSYIVVYRPRSGQDWSERWVVPTSASSLKVNQVRVLNAPVPTVMIQPQQIQAGGATPGQALLWNGSRYSPGNVATSTSWGGILGNFADQADLNNALGGKAPVSHAHSIVDVNGLQTALDGTLKKPPNVFLAETYCATPGVYDHTCLANAINALPSSGGTVHLGDRVYTVGATVAITNKTNIVISGMTPQTYQLVAANNLNASMLNFTNTLNCVLTDVGLDGNKANQTAGSGVEFNVQGFGTFGLLVSKVRIANAKDYNLKAVGYGALSVIASEFVDSGTEHVYVDAGNLMLSSNRFSGAASNISLVYVKNTFSVIVGNNFTATTGFHIPVVFDTGGDITIFGNGTAGTVSGDVLRMNGASAASVHKLISGSTNVGKYQDSGACLGTTPTLTASWASANSLVCLGNNRAAVSMPHGQDTAALFTFDVTGIDLSTGTLTFTPVGHIASTSGNYKWKLEWACTGGSTMPLGDASAPYSTWNVQNINSWWGGFNTQVRGLTNIGVAQTSLPNPCDFLQAKITHTGTDAGETSTFTLSLVGLRIQYYAKTN